MIGWLIANAAPYVIAISVALAALLGYGARQKSKGRRAAETDALLENVKRQEAGRHAVSDIRGADRDALDQRLHDNNAKW